MNIISLPLLFDIGAQILRWNKEQVVLQLDEDDSQSLLEFNRKPGSSLYFLTATRRLLHAGIAAAVGNGPREEGPDDGNEGDESSEGGQSLTPIAVETVTVREHVVKKRKRSFRVTPFDLVGQLGSIN